MKVLFCNPPWWDTDTQLKHVLAGVRAGTECAHTRRTRSSPDHYIFGDPLPYPFAMGSAAAYVAAHTGAKVRFRDSIALREGYQSFFDHLAHQNFDFIFIETSSNAWQHDEKLIRAACKHSPRAKLVVCSLTAFLPPSGLPAALPIEACIIGEYEKAAVSVIEGLTGEIMGVPLTEAEMNQSPPPYLDEIIARRYLDDTFPCLQYPQVHIVSSRPAFICPASASEMSPQPVTGRHFSFEYLHRQLSDAVARFQFRHVCLIDPALNSDPARLAGICQLMGKLRLPWSASCDARFDSDTPWELMRRNGCMGVRLDLPALDSISEVINPEISERLHQVEKTVLSLKSLSMMVHGRLFVDPLTAANERSHLLDSLAASLPFDRLIKLPCPRSTPNLLNPQDAPDATRTSARAETRAFIAAESPSTMKMRSA